MNQEDWGGALLFQGLEGSGGFSLSRALADDGLIYGLIPQRLFAGLDLASNDL
ncbi:hypothetical protein [Methylomonas fluvii]|uniref:Uncharacterized protein n=1 Tax=Methylomonas fluvii TaxID=1854564 RepID=A0ABR9DC30_9GAMM|nr:hypothetical protein [Methylomonas fluvii]MBD9360505.1 hypothetical protein [Methylomonas fluvii]